ncbi:thioredoxin-like domain-containing protein [Butyricimonas muris]|uniref:thioredoxin-like domain-containing protein n=1 Tax=Butyricimonas muris TaxID=3378067 RepID=UPI003966FABA
MFKRNVLIVCMLFWVSLVEAGQYENVADSSHLDRTEKAMLKQIEMIRQRRGIAPREVSFDENATRVGYGFLIYDSLLSGPGIYAINLENLREYKLVSEGWYQVNCGVMVDGKYYTYLMLGGGPNMPVAFCSVDLKTGRRTEICSYRNKKAGEIPVVLQMAYDPVSRRIIGVGGGLYHIDHQTGVIHAFGQLESPLLTFAISPEGIWYGIDYEGNFCEIDPRGAIRRIGFTGIKTWGLQSMAFDPHDGQLYWAMWSDQEKPALYRVELETGKVTRVADMANGAEWAALVIPQPRVAGVPGAIENLTFEGDPNGAGRGVLRWSTPVSSKGNKVNIYRDGKLVTSLKGSVQEYEDMVIPFGEHVYRVTACNKAGEGQSAYVRVFVGKDIPEAVTDVEISTEYSAKARREVVNLKWSPVTRGKNGGHLDTAFLRYHVYRYPDNRKVGTTKNTEMKGLSVGNQNRYYYGIQAEIAAGKGEIAYSEEVVVGTPLMVPYATNFWAEDAKLWKTIDKSGDGKTWGDRNMTDDFCLFHQSLRKVFQEDDLVVSPAIFLKEGHCYRLKFDVKVYNGNPSLHVTFGDKPTAEGQKEILALDSLKLRVYRTYEVDIPRVATRGGYYFGFQTFTSENEEDTGLCITNVRLCEVTDPVIAAKLEKAPAIDNDGETRMYVGYQLQNISGGQTLDGQAFDLAAMEGKLKIIDIWAAGNTDYTGNRTELVALYKDFHKKGLNVVSISFDQDRGVLISAIEQNQMTWPQIHEPATWENNVFVRTFYLEGLPCAILVDENLRVLARVRDVKQLRSLIKALLSDGKK